MGGQKDMSEDGRFSYHNYPYGEYLVIEEHDNDIAGMITSLAIRIQIRCEHDDTQLDEAVFKVEDLDGERRLYAYSRYQPREQHA